MGGEHHATTVRCIGGEVGCRSTSAGIGAYKRCDVCLRPRSCYCTPALVRRNGCRPKWHNHLSRILELHNAAHCRQVECALIFGYIVLVRMLHNRRNSALELASDVLYNSCNVAVVCIFVC